MENKKNQYEKAAKKKSLLGSITSDLETKGDVKNTVIETGKDLLIGVVGGGVVGAAIGRASLAIGAVVTAVGHYTKSRLASIFGLGMMASNGFQKTDKPVSGIEDQNMLEGVKERVMTYKDSLSQKLFLDKLIKSKKTEEKKAEATNGVGEVQYFVYPGSKELEGTEESKALDMGALEDIEQQMAESAGQFELQNKSGSNEMGEVGIEERIY